MLDFDPTNTQIILFVMSVLITVFLFLLGIIGYGIKRFITSVTDSLDKMNDSIRELVVTLGKLQTVTDERHGTNQVEHVDMRKDLEAHDVKIQEHTIRLTQHEEAINNLSNGKQNRPRIKN